MDGIINVYKERGWTSHDVVAKLRGILKQKKIGHTGTLDPEACGVLPVCLGKATKVCELLTDKSKEYRAVLRLGVVTDTQDMTGTVLREHAVTCTEREVSDCIARFVGEQEQIPPMYSALKVGGKKLYELARQGVEVERKPRRITIEELRIEALSLPTVTLTVKCSKGTYIRTLCHDIGEALGCGGCMESLLRTQVGPFTVADSVTLDEILRCRDEDRLSEVLRPTDSVFSHLPAVTLTKEAERLVRNGNPLPEELMHACAETQRLERSIAAPSVQPEPASKERQGSAASAASDQEHTMQRLYAPDGEFLAVYTYAPERHAYRAVKMFL